MPKAAIALGAADEVVNLQDIAGWIRHAALKPLRVAA